MLKSLDFFLWSTLPPSVIRYHLYPDDLCPCRNKDFWSPIPNYWVRMYGMEYRTMHVYQASRWSWDKTGSLRIRVLDKMGAAECVKIRFKFQKIRIQITNTYWQKDQTVSMYFKHVDLYNYSSVSVNDSWFFGSGYQMVSNSQWVFSTPCDN